MAQRVGGGPKRSQEEAFALGWVATKVMYLFLLQAGKEAFCLCMTDGFYFSKMQVQEKKRFARFWNKVKKNKKIIIFSSGQSPKKTTVSLL